MIAMHQYTYSLTANAAQLMRASYKHVHSRNGFVYIV
jgi:hypothetical protein